MQQMQLMPLARCLKKNLGKNKIKINDGYIREEKNMLKGIPASKGYAIGKIFLKSETEIHIDETRAENTDSELKMLKEAVETSRKQLTDLRNKTAIEIGEDEALVFDSHLMFLDDPEFIGAAEKKITDDQHRASSAMSVVTEMFIDIFNNMDNAYMKERAADIKDVGNRIIKNILGIKAEETSMGNDTIVVAHDLTPSDTAQLDKSKMIAFLTDIGGVTSHSAIMARSLQIPAVVGMGNISATVKNGMIAIVDGVKGEVILEPDEKTLAFYRECQMNYLKEREALKVYKNKSLTYPNGRKILVASNIGSVADLDIVIENGADAIGLFRTEFVFMNQETMPTEDEQFEIYKTVAQKMEGKSVVIRTLDIGGDKQIPYLTIEPEMNPFLGLRAIRLCFEHEDIFKTQLRALLRASAFGDVHIMFPMIGALEELDKAKAFVEICKEELRKEGIAFNENIPVGIMVEIPAAAILADEFAKKVDFFSIGTNDLIQYTLAVDRMNTTIAHLYNPMNPSVLKLIEMTIKAAHKAGIWCGMCGEMASDERAIATLASMELDEFSVTGSMVLEVKKRIETVVEK